MKRFLNKGLIYKEWKSSKWFLLLFLLQSLFWILTFNSSIRAIREAAAQGSNISNMSQNYFERFMTNGAVITFGFLAAVVIFATIIVGDDFNGRKYEALCTMPFKREEIVFNKWFVGTVIILIPLIITTAGFFIGYILNRDIIAAAGSYRSIIKWFLLNSLVTIFVYTFIMLIEFLTGKNIIGGICGTIFLFFPLGFAALIDMFTRIAEGNPVLWKTISSIVENFREFAIWISLPLYNVGGVKDYPSTPLRVLILTGGIILCLLLSTYAFKKYSIENIGYIIAFKKLEGIFKVGISVCFGLLFGSIYGQYTISTKRLFPASPEFNVPIAAVNRYIAFTVLVAAATGIGTYLIVRKIIEVNKN